MPILRNRSIYLVGTTISVWIIAWDDEVASLKPTVKSVEKHAEDTDDIIIVISLVSTEAEARAKKRSENIPVWIIAAAEKRPVRSPYADKV